MDIRKAYGTDPGLEANGIDVHINGEAFVTLARAGGGNIKYEAAMKRLFLPHRKALVNGTLDDKTATDILQKVYAESVVLGWRGFEFDGKELQFSPANALLLFKELPEFWKMVQDEAGKFANYRAEEVEDLGKVLRTGLSGGPNGEAISTH